MFVENALELPDPSPPERLHSEALQAIIREEIQKSGGRIDFSRYMELCLYTPQLGYYLSRPRIFGEGGDFITSPELSPYFSFCIARQCAQIFEQLSHPRILEFGGGSGVLAADMLRYLDRINSLPEEYLILDISPALRDKQRTTIEAKTPHLLERVRWLEQMPDKDFEGVVVANEVLDAMPVHRVRFNENGQHEELFVGMDGTQFVWVAGEPGTRALGETLDSIFKELGASMCFPYETEINLAANDWIHEIGGMIRKGVAILIDYGYPRREFFLPERHEGTLMCHYKHRAHAHPLILQGIQDITSHVDFTTVAEQGLDAGFTLAGFASQAIFLAGCGLEQLLQDVDTTDAKAFLTEIQPIKRLVMPQEMGELFKVIALSKDVGIPLIGFSLQDQRYRL